MNAQREPMEFSINFFFRQKYHGNEITREKFISNHEVNTTTSHRSKQKYNMKKGICFEKSNLVPES